MQRQILLVLKQQLRAPISIRPIQRDISKTALPRAEYKDTTTPDAKITSSTTQANRNFFTGFILGTSFVGTTAFIYSLFTASDTPHHSDKILELDEKLHDKTAECAALKKRNEELTSQVTGLSQENADIKAKIEELHTRAIRKPS